MERLRPSFKETIKSDKGHSDNLASISFGLLLGFASYAGVNLFFLRNDVQDIKNKLDNNSNPTATPIEESIANFENSFNSDLQVTSQP